MKDIKGSERLNRANNTTCVGYQIIFLILIFFLSAHVAFADTDKKTETQTTWKEIKLVLDAVDYAWCGNRQIVFGGDNYGKSGKGIRLYDLNSGVIEDITNDPSHRNVSCAADGRYVVFTDDIYNMENKQGSLFVYDRNTKAIKKMHEMERVLLQRIISMPLSPNANYLLGPDLPGVRSYILPGGKEVKVVPYRRGMSYAPEYDRFQWTADENKLLLFDSNGGRLIVKNLEKNYGRNFLYKIKDSWFGDIRVTKNDKLYVEVISFDEIDRLNTINHLYLFDDIEDPGSHVLLVSNILHYDADDEGNVVFSKRHYNRKVGVYDYKLYYLERGKTQPQIIEEIRNIGILPKISRDGKGIIFSISTTPKGTQEFIILIKN